MVRKQIGIYTIIIFLAIIAGIWYIMKDSIGSSIKAMDIIPSEVAVIIEIDKPGELLGTMESGNPMWDKIGQLSVGSDLREGIAFVRKIISDDKDLSQKVTNGRLTISLFGDSISGVKTAVFSDLESAPSESNIKTLLENHLSRDFGVIELPGISKAFKIVNASTGHSQFIAFVNGTLVYTTTPELLSVILDTHKGNNVLSDSMFVKLRNTGGVKAHARVYLNYKKLPRITGNFLNKEKQSEFEWISNFGSWLEFDLLIKNRELILSGFSNAVPSNYLSALNNQDPIMLRSFNILPFNTNQMIWIGVSDFTSYFVDIKSESDLEELSIRLNYDLTKLFPLMTGEIVFASNAEIESNYKNNSWFAFGISDMNQGKAALSRISRNFGNGSLSKYNGYSIGKVNYSRLIPDIFGEVFSQISDNYYTSIGDYIVFANSKQSLITLIDYFETGKTLDLNDNFKEFTDNISSVSNLLIYVKPSDFINRLDGFFTTYAAKKTELEGKVVNSFGGIAFQLTSGKPFSFSNIYTSYAEGQHEESLALWKVQLNDRISWGPYLVYDHQTRTENIIVFDARNNMYLINAEGQVLWTKMLEGVPISDIYEVDFYKNGKVQYMFNTGNNIYLIDKKGRYVTGYPKKLHSRATNGMVIFDYLKNKDYRIVIAQSDKRIYNYTKKGKEVEGWKKPRMQNIVVAPVQRLVANKKDFIIITDINNEVKIVDRKGSRRINLRGELDKAKNSKYYVNRTNSKGIIITTNSSGKLIYISSSGSLNTTDFGNFSPDHFFLYEDFNGDRSKDFIYVDAGKLTVFDRFKNILFSYDFGSDITIVPKFFSLDNKRKVLGVVDDADRTIYLFDEKGNIIISKGLVGETQFIVGDLKNNNKINLVSAADNTLYNYRMK